MKTPDYAELRRLDDLHKKGGPSAFTTAHPYYMAGRPFSPHAPLALEDFYFLVNVPAMSATIELTFGLYPQLMRLVDAERSEAKDSWATAIVFGIFAVLQGFMMASIYSALRSKYRQVDDD